MPGFDDDNELDDLFEDFLCMVEMQKLLIEDPDSFEMIRNALMQHKAGADELVVATALDELLDL